MTTSTFFGAVLATALGAALATPAPARAAAAPPAVEVPLWPAPMFGQGKDNEGRPIPFGVPPYFPPQTPLGSGPYKAVMATDPTAPQHVLYYPADLPAAGKLPIISWGNGGCVHAGNRFRQFLTEIASHGFLVISAGTMGHVALEVGPQEVPFIPRPGVSPPPPAPPPANDPTAQWRQTRSTAAHMKQAVDWAIAENGRQGGRFQGRLDTTKIAYAGQSCGGGLSVEAAGGDPRISTIAIFNSGGTRLTPDPDFKGDAAAFTAAAKARTDAVRAPIMYITGDVERDTGYPVGQEIFRYVTRAPIFLAWEEGLTHIASYGAPNGGALGRIASDWFKWRLKGEATAGRMFRGADCTLCTTPTWHVQKKGLD